MIDAIRLVCFISRMLVSFISIYFKNHFECKRKTFKFCSNKTKSYMVSESLSSVKAQYSIHWTLCASSHSNIKDFDEIFIQLLDDWVCHAMLNCVKDYKKREKNVFLGEEIKKTLYFLLNPCFNIYYHIIFWSIIT